MTIHSEILLALKIEHEKIEGIIDRYCKHGGKSKSTNMAYWYGLLDGIETAMDVVCNRLSIFQAA